MTRVVRAEETGFVDDGGCIYVAALPEGPIVVLTEGAAEAWRRTPRNINDDEPVDDYVGVLVDLGLLTIEEDV